MDKSRSIFHRYPKTVLTFTVIFSTFLFLTLSELFFWSFLKFPVLNNYFKSLRPIMRDIYIFHDRDIIQFLPACSQYDPELTYTLKPGECILKNREYENQVRINSMGLRDDELSLDEPEIIVLGDSHAFGYGVDQDKSFPELIEKMTGLRTLNAAVPSYGTAREMTMLGRLNKEKLKVLIVQYCGNDYGENEIYVKNNFRLENTTKEAFEKVMDEHYQRKRYSPLFYTRAFLKYFLPILKNKIFPHKPIQKEFSENKFTPRFARFVSAESEQPNYPEALYFVNLISRTSFSGKLIILKLYASDDFEDGVQYIISTGDYPPFVKEAAIIRTADLLTENDYFILDDHINESGHKKITDEILKIIHE